METFVVLWFGAFAGALIYSSLLGTPSLIFRRWKNFVDEFLTRKVQVLEKNVDKHAKPSRIFIPNMLPKWPWLRRVNPNYAAVKKESDAWLMSFQFFSPKAQATYILSDANLLASMAYPTASKEYIRVACDFLHLLFILDEYSDRSAPAEIRKQKSVVIDAFLHPYTPRPKGEWVGGELTRQRVFWERGVQIGTEVAQKRFIRNIDEYLEEVIQESVDKNDHHILDIKSYTCARRSTGAVKPSFSLIELVLGLDIPDEVMSHPAIQEIVLTAVDIISFSNDIASYNIERLRGDDLHNIITCVMNEHDTDVNGATLWVEDFLHAAEEKFCDRIASLPQWEEPLNSQVKDYCNGLGQWVRANNEWSFESERYFGNKGLQVKDDKWVSLLPRKSTTEIGPVRVENVLFD